MRTVQILPPRAKLAHPAHGSAPRRCRRCGLVIATEFMLFACMFAAYYYLGSNKDRWAERNVRRSLIYAVILLVILLGSSVVLAWGERQVKAERFGAGTAALWMTVLLGIGLPGAAGIRVQRRIGECSPRTATPMDRSFTPSQRFMRARDCRASCCSCMSASCRDTDRRAARRTQPYTTVSLYWHFVDAVWIFIVALLYIIPHFQAHFHGH